MMNWINPHGSLWATPTFGGRFFSADCEAVYQTDKVGVHVQPPVERFPSTAEGIHRLLNEFRRLSRLLDAVGDDMDIYGIHQALGLLEGGHFAFEDDETSVYDCPNLLAEASEYQTDLEKVMGILYLDLLRAWHSQSGAQKAIETWSVVNRTTMEELLGQISEGEPLEDEVSWHAETEGWTAPKPKAS